MRTRTRQGRRHSCKGEKPWRATAQYTDWRNADGEAADALSTAMAERYFEHMTHAIDTRHQLPAEWRQAEWFGDDVVYLTAAELTEVGKRFSEILGSYAERLDDPSLRPQDAAPVTMLRIAIRRRKTTTSQPDEL